MEPEPPDPTDARSEQRQFALVAMAFAFVAALAALDLISDLQEGTTVQHAIIEGFIVALGGGGLAFGLRRVLMLRKREREAIQEARELKSRLVDSRAEAERWREEAQELLMGLGEMIEVQFDRWDLTPAEREVALLLLKGYSHKEVAIGRRVGAATVRQQATGIYKKAGVGGRHDLSAFFLEDLLAGTGSPSQRG